MSVLKDPFLSVHIPTLHIANREHRTRHRKADVEPRKGYAIHAGWIALIRRSRILREHAVKRLPFFPINPLFQLFGNDNAQRAVRPIPGKPGRGLRTGSLKGEDTA